MRFSIATYDEERSVNRGVYETQNKPIMELAQINEHFSCEQTCFSYDFMNFAKLGMEKHDCEKFSKNAIDGKKVLNKHNRQFSRSLSNLWNIAICVTVV